MQCELLDRLLAESCGSCGPIHADVTWRSRHSVYKPPPPRWRYAMLQQCNVVNLRVLATCWVWNNTSRNTCPTTNFDISVFRLCSILLALSVPPTWRRCFRAQFSDVTAELDVDWIHPGIGLDATTVTQFFLFSNHCSTGDAGTFKLWFMND